MLSMVPVWGLVPSADDGSLDIALNEFPMRDLRKDLSCAAHKCTVRRRIETQAIGHPRGGVAKIAINADQARSRGCGIAARLARNVIMRWTDQRWRPDRWAALVRGGAATRNIAQSL